VGVLGAREDAAFYEAQSSDLDALDCHVGLHPAAVRRGARKLGLKLNGEERAWSGQVGTGFSTTIKAYGARTGHVLPKSPEGQSEQLRVVELEGVNFDTARTASLEIDNNGCRNASLRGIAVGRRNWMF